MENELRGLGSSLPQSTTTDFGELSLDDDQVTSEPPLSTTITLNTPVLSSIDNADVSILKVDGSIPSTTRSEMSSPLRKTPSRSNMNNFSTGVIATLIFIGILGYLLTLVTCPPLQWLTFTSVEYFTGVTLAYVLPGLIPALVFTSIFNYCSTIVTRFLRQYRNNLVEQLAVVV